MEILMSVVEKLRSLLEHNQLLDIENGQRNGLSQETFQLLQSTCPNNEKGTAALNTYIEGLRLKLNLTVQVLQFAATALTAATRANQRDYFRESKQSGRLPDWSAALEKSLWEVEDLFVFTSYADTGAEGLRKHLASERSKEEDELLLIADDAGCVSELQTMVVLSLCPSFTLLMGHPSSPLMAPPMSREAREGGLGRSLLDRLRAAVDDDRVEITVCPHNRTKGKNVVVQIMKIPEQR